MSIEVGTKAPDFALKNQHGQTVRLSDFRGSKKVVVVFYPFAFSEICTGELCAIRDEAPVFVDENVQTLAISCDPVHSLRAFGEVEGISYPLLSDFYPHGEVATQYGVFLPEFGFATRATFIIDDEGVVRWAVVNGPGDARSTVEYREALAALG